jgi:hypothetical protein
MKTFFLILVATFSGFAQAAKPFQTLVCKRTLSDEVSLTVKGKQLSVQWVSRGGDEMVQLPRALADKAIPDSLLEAYNDVHVEFSIPLEACSFDAVPGAFSCDFKKGAGKALPLRVLAKLSPYDLKAKPDVYNTGRLSRVAWRSGFYGKKDSRELKFSFEMELESPTAATLKGEVDSFYAHAWRSEGFPQNPSCKLDGAYLEN